MPYFPAFYTTMPFLQALANDCRKLRENTVCFGAKTVHTGLANKEVPVERPKVFICYAKQDMTKASDLYDRLEAAGADPWFDKRKLELGDDWEQEIRKAVKNADVFVACLRPEFNDIGFRQKEIRWALDALQTRPPGKGFIIPFIIEPCELPDWCFPIHAGADLGRPTEFVELLRAIEKHCAVTLKRPEERRQAAPAWLSELGSILVTVLADIDEFQERSNVGGWLDPLSMCCPVWAERLRRLAIDDLVDHPELSERLTKLADQCDEVVTLLRFANSSTHARLERILPGIRQAAEELKAREIDPIPFSGDAVQTIRNTIKSAARRARDLAGRMDKLISLRFDDLQSECSNIGGEVLQVAYYKLGFLNADHAEALRQAGRELRLVKGTTLYADGGESTQRVFDRIRRAAQELERVAAAI
jgi:hypothetical protein